VDGQSLYCLRKSSTKYVEGWVIAVNANTTTLLRRVNIDDPRPHAIKNIAKKEKEMTING
jgi:hypothetical protein